MREAVLRSGWNAVEWTVSGTERDSERPRPAVLGHYWGASGKW